MREPDPNPGQFDVLSWLNAFEPGAHDLRGDEISSVTQFALMWGLFEDQVCQKSASVRCFRKRVQQWSDAGILQLEQFDPYLEYFQNRYLGDGEPNHRFEQLRIRNSEERERVAAVLKGENRNAVDIVTAALAIVYRYRNNLFHGLKWVYALHGQAENFVVANRILAQSLETHRRTKMKLRN